MPAQQPDRDQVLRAIELYLSVTYGSAALPLRVRTQLEAVKAWQGDILLASPFVADSNAATPRYNLRLGNPFYPHMKLVVETAPNGEQFLYRADTHDRHCCPAPGSKEYGLFCELMERNQKLAEAVESAWAEAGLPTFKTFLKEDLKRRQAMAGT